MDKAFDAGIGYFLWSLSIGVVLAFAYDVIRTARKLKKTPDLMINIEDILYCMSAGILLLLTAYDKNGGRLRWQGIMGTLAGGGIYYALLKNYMVVFLTACCRVFVRIIIRILKIILFPARIAYKILAKPFTVICWHTGQRARRIKEAVRTEKKKRKMHRKCMRAERLKRRTKRGGNAVKN